MNEDVPYQFGVDEVDDDEQTTKDPDAENASVLVVVSHELGKLIKQHNTFDVIDPNSKLSVEQQFGAHRKLVQYLRQYKGLIDSKIEELS